MTAPDKACNATLVFWLRAIKNQQLAISAHHSAVGMALQESDFVQARILVLSLLRSLIFNTRKNIFRKQKSFKMKKLISECVWPQILNELWNRVKNSSNTLRKVREHVLKCSVHFHCKEKTTTAPLCWCPAPVQSALAAASRELPRPSGFTVRSRLCRLWAALHFECQTELLAGSASHCSWQCLIYFESPRV